MTERAHARVWQLSWRGFVALPALSLPCRDVMSARRKVPALKGHEVDRQHGQGQRLSRSRRSGRRSCPLDHPWCNVTLARAQSSNAATNMLIRVPFRAMNPTRVSACVKPQSQGRSDPRIQASSPSNSEASSGCDSGVRRPDAMRTMRSATPNEESRHLDRLRYLQEREARGVCHGSGTVAR